MYFIIFVIHLSLCLLCDSFIVPSVPDQVIVGGENAADEFPYVVALYYDNQFICTSTIISPTTVMTAAHCVVLNGVLQSADLYHGIANINRTAPQVRIEFTRIIPNPEYMEGTVDNDVAILKTASPILVEGDILINPICLAGPDYRIRKRAFVVGWGRISNDNLTIPEILQYADQKIVPNLLCGFVNVGINENKVCAKGTRLRSGICNGDSGGPLISRDDEVQIGISSYINGLFSCGDIPAVFTRISQFTTFIKEAAGDSVCFR